VIFLGDISFPWWFKAFLRNVIPKLTIQMGMMVTSMSVRCPQCFYENEERYRFCGMCGIALPRVGAASEPEVKAGRPATAAINSRPEPVIPASAPAREQERAPTPVTGMSFLGLSQDQNPYPDRSLDYLLEEEPQSGRTRTYVALVLLLAAVAMLGWRWRHSGFLSRPHPAVATTPSATDSSSPDSSATPAASAPAASPAPSTTPVNPSAQTSHGPQESDLPPGGESGSEAVKPAQSVQNADQTSSTDTDNSGNSNTPAKALSTEAARPVPVEKPKASPPAIARATPKATHAAAPIPVATVPEQDPLETAGERYLYGTGVPQNCGLAEKSLLAAAKNANPKAQSVLGTMYATGHCVGRDLPTAYRWFARASHQDPNNARITRDLEVLWKQMTAGERQWAVSNRE
jgi:hypothetical protein